ncbi:MAG: TetR/AcrR family transcriptional regulator [Erysipelotrichaceae bacterium]|nr:TetR/AcrR family transcriptional regulator [Erysipelotrichaceae bacterium]
MDMIKEDARISRSKKALRESLIQLLQERSFDKVTVKDICAHAGINKMTFYSHYQDKYDLLDDCGKAVASRWLAEVKARLRDVPVDDLPAFFADTIITATDAAMEMREVILSIDFKSNSLGSEVLSSVLENVIADFVHTFGERYTFAYEEEYIVAFLSGGFSKAVGATIHNGHYDREYYREAFRRSFARLIRSRVLEKE